MPDYESGTACQHEVLSSMFGLRMLNETWQRWDMLGAALIRSSLATFVGLLLVQSSSVKRFLVSSSCSGLLGLVDFRDIPSICLRMPSSCVSDLFCGRLRSASSNNVMSSSGSTPPAVPGV